MVSHKVGDVVVVRGRPYQLLSLVGKGGQGSVFAARSESGEKVAVKLVPASGRHHNEAKILASLKSDHVVRLLDAGKTRDSLILVLEHVSGVDLKALIRLCQEEERMIPPRLAVEIIQQVCLGLLEAYQHGQLAFHRDIKPGNVMLGRSGVVKLIDFGIAHRTGMEYTGSLLGTPENMAPEQVGLEQSWKVDVRTDLYCAGLVLYELLTLETIHTFERHTPPAKRLLKVWDADVNPRIEIAEAIHPALGRFLRKALQRKPADRFQTPVEMLHALADLRKKLPSAPKLELFADCLYQVTQRNEACPYFEEVLPPARRKATESIDPTATYPSVAALRGRRPSPFPMAAVFAAPALVLLVIVALVGLAGL